MCFGFACRAEWLNIVAVAVLFWYETDDHVVLVTYVVVMYTDTGVEHPEHSTHLSAQMFFNVLLLLQ